MVERLNAMGDLLDFPRGTDAVRPSLGDALVRPAGELAPALPTGTVTFLLTAIEGSTRAWEAQGERMGEAVAPHHEIIDAAVTSHRGVDPHEQSEGGRVL